MSVWTIVVAAGSGACFGGLKQYETMGDRRVLDWSVAAARSVSDGVVLVVPPERLGDAEPGVSCVVVGGVTRSGSVRAGLAAVPDDAEIVVVHDGARPAATRVLFDRVIEAVRSGADAAITAVSIVDTVKRVSGARVMATVARDDLVAVQTPQAFRATALRAAHATGGEATDDAALVELTGGTVVHVAGDPVNRKITTTDDLAVLRAAGPWARVGSEVGFRVGTGYDIHPFSSDAARPLVLGGVVFPESAGLAGHSDADAVAHAITDALLGASGLGDIGQHFPDTDPEFEGANSLTLLGAAVALVRREGWSVVNVDCTVVLEAPKLAPYRDQMQARLAEVVGAPVAVKAKRAEGLGALGRREGIACHAVALIGRP